MSRWEPTQPTSEDEVGLWNQAMLPEGNELRLISVIIEPQCHPCWVLIDLETARVWYVVVVARFEPPNEHPNDEPAPTQLQ